MPSAVVVGAGVFGASIARHLSGQGWQVTMVDRRGPGNAMAASAGHSRLIRCGHGSDAFHTRMARRARELWREVEAEAGAELLVECGLAWLAHREGGWESESERLLRAEGIPVERLDPGTAADLLPGLSPAGLEFVLLEPEAGVLRAQAATEALAGLACRSGTTLRTGMARPDRDAAVVEGERLEADRVVWACGAWLGALFGDLVELRVTRQDVLHFAGPPEWRTPPVPAWVDYDGAIYGLGDLDGRGVKVCPDREGPALDPETGERRASTESEDAARAYLADRFPALAGAALTGTESCPYALTPDTNFIAAPHPECDRVWIVGGGSGHGFKHGPAWAELVCGWIAGEEPPDPRFGLGPREADRSLRTAGAGTEPV